MSPLAHTSPLRGGPDVRIDSSEAAQATYLVAKDEPLLAGHYPDFPIFPGVCLLDLIVQTAQEHHPQRRLRRIRSTRFTGPVFPSDEVDVFVEWKQRDGQWSCRGRVVAASGTAASATLLYDEEEN
ncbi:hypothetical protein [Haloglycomyces albus]|uniref:hypothetical protein n=1 Tax=Haloglycomyces albus TaxID=526067 RepID=UPI00046D0C89|nr:hypothetical protein [Haloglycomyces albus]